MKEYRKISPIRDPIHNYISFSLFEREIIDSPYFQRLHFVLQNSAAYTTYPANKNSRYIHSIGVSHLCGRIFIHALKNGHSTDVGEFLAQAERFVNQHIEKVDTDKKARSLLLKSWKRRIGNGARFLHNPFLGEALDLTQERPGHFPPEMIINTLWISLRMCGLVHDIGHLPMSHLFEDAIVEVENSIKIYQHPHSESLIAACRIPDEDILSPGADLGTWRTQQLHILQNTPVEFDNLLRSLQLHEKRGIKILDLILRDIPDDYDESDKVYRKLLFSIAQSIVLASTSTAMAPKNAFLIAMKRILSSELDADRLDYTARDPHASGLDTGSCDIDRIVSNFILGRHEDTFHFAISEKCISAAEHFFHERYLNYSTLIYHRTNVKFKAVLREGIVRLIYFASSTKKTEITEVLVRSGFLEFDCNGIIKRIAPSDEFSLKSFDDARLRSAFFDILYICDNVGKHPETQRLSANEKTELNAIAELLRTFLFRKSDNIISYGKGHSAIRNEQARFNLEGMDPHILSDMRVRSKFEQIVQKKRQEIHVQTKGAIGLLYTRLTPKIYGGANKEFTSTYVALPQANNPQAAHILQPLEKISPFISMQPRLIEKDADFAISFVGNSIARDSEARKMCDDWYSQLLKTVADSKNRLKKPIRKRRVNKTKMEGE
jgi:uncharacterized protein